ncbi:SoxR reducing system RseC family protein [Aquimonas voraii]|uniref:Positive regulator of sigma(E), RseC/MucC n=1 Tax=Aquimonas voraii TaxID=265719 RepID=A0A1G6U634_9GAMM|nr:SoxR reducing system RseC family protein [Aquimonas voraii]SDD36146.1 positive regulator of sigma(E), RseC/MucC [Aquimonas voraii]
MERRRALVLDSCPGRLRLRYTAQCSGCGGCGGRCSVFLADASDVFELATPPEVRTWRAGEAVEVELPSNLLLRQALLGYGLPLLGLLGGAALASPWGNASAAAGALLGTLLAVHVSKRAAGKLPAPRVRPVPTPPSAAP